jgi:hypothetical protein
MITGTFLDEITHDIPYSNWGPEEWDADFAAMRAVGIDTVILIRAGYRDRATFESNVLKKLHPHLIVQMDLVQLFLDLAQKNGMKFYFGTYDSGNYWHSGQYQKESDLNRAFCDEVIARYGAHPAFQGWYISHEINAFDEGVMKIYEELARHLTGLKKLPVLISPYIRGPKQFPDQAITLGEHEKEWAQVFARIKGLVDIVAFQDGNVEYDKLHDFLRVNATLARANGLTCWSNVESFDRDMPIKFPPIGWPKLRFKVDAARAAGVDKLITFEFSHFMSPNSIYPAAHHLYRRYREHYCVAMKG